MRNGPLDIEEALRRCADEPIHIPGGIQRHGALLAIRLGDGIPDDRVLDGAVIEYASANAGDWLGVEAQSALGRSLADILPKNAADAVADVVRQAPIRRQSARFSEVVAAEGRSWTVGAHRCDDLVVLEFESVSPGDCDPSFIGDQRLPEANNIHELAVATAKRAAALTGFDRCMVYRFLPDWSGEVIAETRDDDMTPYLGLRYPAGDIPEQARRLYLCNVMRSVADVDALTQPLLARNDAAPPLDLTYAGLRAVSPVHLRYMRNIGAAASVTGSIIVGGRLWGLIACHHRAPRLTPPSARSAFIALTEATAAAIAKLEAARRDALGRRVAHRLQRILGIVDRKNDNVALRLLTDDPGLADLAGADGAAVAIGGRILTFGLSPQIAAFRTLAGRIAEDAAATSDIVRIERLAEHPLAAGVELGPVVGLLATRVSPSNGDGPAMVVAAFRGELTREIFWGGDPSKPMASEGDRLEPRVSFALWRQKVTGCCREWDDDSVDGWRGLKALLGDGRPRAAKLISRFTDDIEDLAQRARTQDELVRSCVNAISQPSIVVRHDVESAFGRTLAANRAFRGVFHIMADEIEGNSFPALLQSLGFDPERVAVLPPGSSVEAQVTAAGVGDRWFAIRRTPLLCVGVKMTHSALSLWSMEDVTAHRRVVAALRAAQLKAEATDRAKSSFLATVSHELRTPLNAIIGFSEMMIEQVLGDLGNPRYHAYAEHINTSGRHLLDIVSDVLDITRIERGAYSLNEEVFDVAGAFRSCAAMAERLAEKRGVSTSVKMSPDAIMMVGDPRAVRQILLNLMTNAVKFTPAGGAACFSLRGGEGDPITATIVDNGVGIDANHRDRVFEPFYQASQRSDATESGLGLGLALVKLLTELHDGFVELMSGKGVGTTVAVQFPLWRSQNPCQPSTPRVGPSPPI